jgi:hypothetical protein
MLIWILMAIGLVVIVLGGFVGRSRQTRNREQAVHNSATHHTTTHHGKGARKSRGRGRH